MILFGANKYCYNYFIMKKNLTTQEAIEWAVKREEYYSALGFQNVDAREYIKMKLNELRTQKITHEIIESYLNTSSK